MFTVTKISDERVDIDLEGGIDANIMTAGLDELLRQSEGMENGKMLYTIADFELPTLGAIAVEIGKLPALFSLVHRFDKCALVSDAGWIRTAGELEGALIPGLVIKSFTMDEKSAAEAWLAVR